MNRGFLVKIVPPDGYDVYRLRFGRRHLVAAAVLVVALLVGAAAVHTRQLAQAEGRVRALESLTAAQRERITTIDDQATSISRELQRLEREDAELRALIDGGAAKRGGAHARVVAPPAARRADLAAVASEMRRLAAAAAARRAEAERLHRLAARVINARRFAEIARGRLIAAIPSINPVAPGTAIADGFGWRNEPWPEFHKGVDLVADVGTPVRAAAAGTVVSADWDGGFGIKVDIDHGNGYHTWYAHLSRPLVHPGDRIAKGQTVALSGSTGASTGPHVHYQVMKDGTPIDPAPFLAGIPPAVLASLSASPDAAVAVR